MADQGNLATMSRTRQADADYVSLTSGDMVRFHRNAPAALARRSGGAKAQSVMGSLELVIIGGTPIVGMLWYDWSATQQLVFLVASLWVGILCDFARLALVRPAVKAYADEHYDDWHVWVVVEALRSGRNTAPRSHIQAKHAPADGVFVDLAAGGFSTVLIAAALFVGQSGRFIQSTFDRAFVVSLAAMAAYQALNAAWEIVRVRRALAKGGGLKAGGVSAAPGARGVALFLLMFVTMTLGDPDGAGGVAAQRVMLGVNGVIVAVGVLNAAAWLWLGSETRWLARYVREHRAEVDAARLEQSVEKKKGKKRKR
jgi:hypothetical protein